MFSSADIIIDRLKLKSDLNKWKLISTLILTFLLLYIARDNIRINKNNNQDYIAKVKIEGIITEDLKRNKSLNDLAESERVKAIILYINSPGGTFVGSEDIYNSIRNIAKTKPVIAIMGTVAASGGYMSAIAADYILAHNGTITGSIGVILQSIEISELAKKIGINFLTYKSGKYKATPSFAEKPSDDINKVINESIMDNYDMFVEMVAERRNLSKEEVMHLADGRIYTGRQAVSNRLIDAIGDEHEAMKWLVEEKKIDKSLNIKDINLNEEPNFIKRYISKMSIFNNIEKININSILAIWYP